VEGKDQIRWIEGNPQVDTISYLIWKNMKYDEPVTLFSFFLKKKTKQNNYVLISFLDIKLSTEDRKLPTLTFGSYVDLIFLQALA